jgi:hypothetical protein
VAVFAIAAVLVGREASRLAAAPPRPVFDMDEAVVWIADRLPESVSSQLSHADVDRAAEAGHDWSAVEVKAVLDGQSEYLQVIGAAGPVPSLPPERGGGPTEDRQ